MLEAPSHELFLASPGAVGLEWGPTRVRQLAAEFDYIVALDVMSFSTCVDNRYPARCSGYFTLSYTVLGCRLKCIQYSFDAAQQTRLNITL
jgi:hypothetical protein